MISAITGPKNNCLKPYISQAIDGAEKIRLIIAFTMESGVRQILSNLISAASRGVPIQLLTGRYLSVTEPSAIYLLYEHLGDSIDIRFYNDTFRSFHPKSYIFDFSDDAVVFVGSSNLSRSALTNGIEWNYQLFKSEHPSDYAQFSDTFNLLFNYHSEKVTDEVLKEYALKWKKPKFLRVEDSMVPEPPMTIPLPRGAQIEALYYLKQSRLEGIEKGVVVAATGVGKTHLASFDTLGFKRVLFVAHRDEILKQAYDIFQSIRPHSKMGFYNGKRKDHGADIYFAGVQTLSREENLNYFDAGYFDYIIIDEFHHAAADSYQKLIDYFKPKFLLGMTATPYRLDNQDIYTICDDNVIYEISLRQAIERDMLVPFQYQAIYDPTDYDQIRMVNGRYMVEDLENQLSRHERADIILRSFRRLAGNQTLGFCVSINHAEYMANYFNKLGISSTAVHSAMNQNGNKYDRVSAIEALTSGELKVVFAVDIFNEGVDIPSIDTVMFLRPTESYTVFLQQLGRGLRRYKGKEFLTVIDFIGNFKRAHYIPLLLEGKNPVNILNESTKQRIIHDYPDGCTVNFDFRIIDLFDELAKRDPLPVRLKDTFWYLKNSLGRRPTRKDIYMASDIPIREFLKNGWLRFLASIEELTAIEMLWLDTPVEDFIKEIERTRFTKAYKLPTIQAFLGGGSISQSVALLDIAKSMKAFYSNNLIHQKDLNTDNNGDWRTWSIDKWAMQAKNNPVHFLSQGRFFNYDEINKVMYLDSELTDSLSSELAFHINDILEYRETDYFR